MNKKSIQPRIITGLHKGFRLEVPQNTRPITDRVKTVMFDKIKDIIDDSSILDLFAASGNIGIEALSRGAKLAIFVDNSEDSYDILKQNLTRLMLPKDSHKIFKMDYLDFLQKFNGSFDIIFLDPPFDIQNKIRLDLISKFINKTGLIIFKVEDKKRNIIKIPEGLEIIEEKKVGINILLFLKTKWQ